LRKGPEREEGTKGRAWQRERQERVKKEREGNRMGGKERRLDGREGMEEMGREKTRKGRHGREDN